MLEGKEEEIGDINTWLETNGVTNLQLFRKYMLNWIKMRGDVRPDMYLVIRTMPPHQWDYPLNYIVSLVLPHGWNMKRRNQKFLSI